MERTVMVRKLDHFRKLAIPSAIRGSIGMNKSTVIILNVDEAGLIRIIRDDEKSIVKMDDSGITLPQFWTVKHNWNENDEFEIWTENGVIYARKKEPSCIFTGSTENLIEFRGKWIAKKVFEEMKTI